MEAQASLGSKLGGALFRDNLAFLELTTAEVENSMHTISSAIRSSSMPKSSSVGCYNMFCSVADLCQLVFPNEAVWPNGQGARLRIWRLQVRVLPRSTIFQKIASNNK